MRIKFLRTVAFKMERLNNKLKIPTVLLEAIINGTEYQANSTQQEKGILKEHSPILPFPKNNVRINMKNINFIPSTDINQTIKLMLLICRKNNRNDLTEIENSLWQSIIYVAATSGMIKSDSTARYAADQNTFEQEMAGINVENMTEDEALIVNRAFEMTNVAVNVISASVINFIRFNHHFGSNAINLNYKMFLPYVPNDVPNFINERNEFTQRFYETIYGATKLVNEVLWHYRVITLKLTEIPDTNANVVNSPILSRYIAVDRIITVRAYPTVNIFTPLSLLRLVIEKLNEYHLAPLLIRGEIEAKVNLLDQRVRDNPFNYHPSRSYFNINTNDYNDACKLRDNILELYAGIAANFCQQYGSTLRNARSIQKFIDNATNLQIAIITFYFELRNTGVQINNAIKEIIKQRNSIQDIEINDESGYNEIISDYNEQKNTINVDNLYQ